MAQLQAGGCGPAEGREQRVASLLHQPEHPPPGIIVKAKDGSRPRWWDGCGSTLPWPGNSTPTPK